MLRKITGKLDPATRTRLAKVALKDPRVGQLLAEKHLNSVEQICRMLKACDDRNAADAIGIVRAELFN